MQKKQKKNLFFVPVIPAKVRWLKAGLDIFMLFQVMREAGIDISAYDS
jgi:hypothetical protein